MRLKSRFRSKHVMLLLLALLLVSLLLSGAAQAAEQLRISAVSPGCGPISGGQIVTITGSGFTAGGTVIGVTFGGAAGTGLSVVSDTLLTVTTPAHAAGVADVTVDRQSRPAKSATLKKAYTYLTGPTLTQVSPSTRTYPAGGP
jgi:hypothetical protein